MQSKITLTTEEIFSLCACCGKKLKANFSMVEMTVRGMLTVRDTPEEKSQGFFPVGPDCFKKVQKQDTEAKAQIY